jgi:response regulator RpfG family c-di-GMP phosphodiesterase
MRAAARTTPSQPLLLIEDDAPTRNMLARHLHNSGYQVTGVESAEDALAEVDHHGQTFAVVISDVHLPGISGIDLASVLLVRNPAQPIVLMTGDPDEALARDALSRGPVSYLLKPFELLELDAAVQQAVVRTATRVPNAREQMREEHSGGEVAIAALEEWLQFVDQHSYAGPGHADRVSRIAATLLVCLPEAVLEISPADLMLAARAHEIGRLEGPTADPTELAAQGAQLLADCGFHAVIVRIVRHLHERWDGTGGPDRLAGSTIPQGSLVLAAADSLDHYCSAWIQAGMKPADAVDRAIGLVIVQQGTLFSPLVARAVHGQRSTIRAICTVGRPVERKEIRRATVIDSTIPRNLRLV